MSFNKTLLICVRVVSQAIILPSFSAKAWAEFWNSVLVFCSGQGHIGTVFFNPVLRFSRVCIILPVFILIRSFIADAK